MSEWETLGAVEPGKLIDARVQLHWAAQAAAGVGKLLLPRQPDFSEQSLCWMEEPRALAQGLVTGKAPFRSAVRFSPPALLLMEDGGGTLRELSLEGRTLDEAYDWVRREVGDLFGRPLEQPLERPEGLPEHPVATGAPFTFPDPAVAAELARYYAGADRLLRGVRERNAGASPVLCWPHHFDIATLIRLDDGAGAETARSISAGLSPGDGSRPEPYLYILPWPPPKGELPALDSGGWNTGGWVGAVMEAAEFLGVGPNGAQRGRMERFLDSAIAACRPLLLKDRLEDRG